MADVVQFKLERMLNELDDLEKRGLFSRQEIAEIVKQRRKFEYRLKRHSPLKQDYLSYIAYEKQLDTLRRLRKKSLYKKSGAKKMRKSVSDFAGVSRIIKIYRLATTRFKGDIGLWFEYLEYCKARAIGRMKKALAQLVRFHPKVPGVWIYAAAWEFDTNLNVAAARALMQNGLRECPSSEDLWIEYLQMELTYLCKLKARKNALGEGGDLVRNQKTDKEQDVVDLPLNDIENVDESVLEDGASDDKQDVVGEHGLSLLQIVYRGAVEALPSSFSLRVRCCEILEGNQLLHCEDLQKLILDGMRSDFAKDPKYWDWLARAQVGCFQRLTPENLNKSIQVYDEALESVPSALMAELYAKFLMELVGEKNFTGDAGNTSESGCHAVDLVAHLREVFEKAENLGSITEDFACRYIKVLLELGKQSDAKMLIEKLCNEKLSNAVQLWALRLSIEFTNFQACPPSKADNQRAFELLKSILMRFSISEAESIWLMGLKHFSTQRRYFDKIVEISYLVLARDGGSDDGFSLSSTILSHIFQRDGVASMRNTYKRLIALPHPGLVLYRKCIELELNLAETGDKTGLPNARKLYESALATYDQDPVLWQEFYSMEVKMGTSETASAVHWRATKALKGTFSIATT